MKKIILALSLIFLFAAGCNNSKDVRHKQQNQSSDPAANWETYHIGGYQFDIKYPSGRYKLGSFASGYSYLFNEFLQVYTPKERFPNTNFGDAALTVSNQTPLVYSEKKCLAIRLPPNLKKFSNPENINGVIYYSGMSSGAGAGNFYEQKIYRTFKNGNCFEFTETLHTLNIGNFPAGTVTAVNKQLIWQELEQIMHTVKF